MIIKKRGKQCTENFTWIKKQKHHPHTFRHSTALHLLQSGVDISTIAIWLRNESITTTHKYMKADIDMKQRTLEKMAEPSGETNSYRRLLPMEEMSEDINQVST